MKKKLQLVLIPKNYKINALLGYSDKSILFNRPYSKEYSENDLEKPMSSYFHLYAISDKKPKIGDYVINTTHSIEGSLKVVENQTNHKEVSLQYVLERPRYKQIVITTDESIGYTDYEISPVPNFCSYPTFNNDFINTYIEKYNSGNIISEIEVEYDSISCGGDINYSYADFENCHPDEADQVFHCEKCQTEYRNPSFNYGKKRTCYNKEVKLKTNSDNTVNVFLIDEKLQKLVNLLEKAGVRKYTCINNFGYSQLERDIVDLFQDKLYTKEEVINKLLNYKTDLLVELISSNDIIDRTIYELW